MRVLPKQPNSSKVNHRYPQYYYVLGVIFERPGLCQEEICDKVGVDYINNGNKRFKRMYRRIAHYVDEYVGRDGKLRYRPNKKFAHLSSSEVKQHLRNFI